MKTTTTTITEKRSFEQTAEPTPKLLKRRKFNYF